MERKVRRYDARAFKLEAVRLAAVCDPAPVLVPIGPGNFRLLTLHPF